MRGGRGRVSQCVLLSDVDEIIVPDPKYYPGGLSEYVAKFAADPNRHILRANGYIVAHVSQPDGDEHDNLEPPMNWYVRRIKKAT